MSQRITYLLFLLHASQTLAEPATPLLAHDQNPLVQIHGLPSPTTARLPAPGHWRSDWSLNLTNTLNIETTSNEYLYIDGESYRFNLFAEYGINRDWGLRFELPLISHTSGALDQAIDEFHEAFNFNQGFRPKVPRDQFLFLYRRNNTEQFRLQSPRSGPGDLQIMLARSLIASANTDLSVWMDLKLPTGDSNKLTGSGASDFATWLATRHNINSEWQLYGTSGLLIFGEADILNTIQEDTAWFGNFGTEWQVWPHTALKVQLDWHTAFYKQTEIRFLNDVVQLSIGGHWKTSATTQLELSLSEDIKRDASPDITFTMTFKVLH